MPKRPPMPYSGGKQTVVEPASRYMPDLTHESIAELREQALMSRCYSGGRAVGIAPDKLIALLDAAARLAEVEAERDALAAKVERVRAMHVRHSDHRPAQIINGPWYCCARAQLGAVAMDDCNVCGEYWPCPTIRALDGTETDHADALAAVRGDLS